MKRKWFLGVVLAAVPLVVSCQDLSDYPYLFLTGYSERELVKMSRLSVRELEERIGLSEVPGGSTARTRIADEPLTPSRAISAHAAGGPTSRWPSVT